MKKETWIPQRDEVFDRLIMIYTLKNRSLRLLRGYRGKNMGVKRLNVEKKTEESRWLPFDPILP